ncbi:hypothetical protein ACFL5F_04365 [Planctomycetota bacterium]
MAQTTVLIGVNLRLTESYLKKQSQFLKGKNDVTTATIMCYGDFGWLEWRGNKAKQSQYAGLWPEILSTKR